MGLLARIASLGVLRGAWARVRARNAGPGIDRVTVAQYAADVDDRLAQLSVALEHGQWSPKPGRRLQLEADPDRPIVVACVEDRIVQRAMSDVLVPFYERRLTRAARAYRPGHAMDETLRWVAGRVSSGRRWYARTDVAKFFDEIDRPLLLDRLAADGVDTDVVGLVSRLLRAGAVEYAVVTEPGVGVGQGSALSPLLSNAYLSAIDADLLDAGFTYVRYADDILFLGATEVEVVDALERLRDRLEAAKLRLNLRKTRRGHVRDGFTFLGAHFDLTGRTVAESVIVAVAERAQASAEGPGSTLRLVETLDELTQWYGVIAVTRMTTLPMLAGWALRLDRTESRAYLRRAAAQRLALPAAARVAAETHVALVELWMALAADEGSGPEVRRAAVLDAREALRQGPSFSERARLSAALGLNDADLGGLRGEWPEVAEHLARCSRRSLAWAARQLAAPETAAEEVPAPVEATADDAVLRALLEVWRGQDGVHVVEQVDGRGHSNHVLHRGPIGLEDLRAHLRGGPRLGFYLVRPDETVLLACIESHARRDAVVPAAGAGVVPGSAQDTLQLLAHRVHDDAVSVGRAARKFGVVTAFEAADRFSRRQWIHFDAPVPLRHARTLVRLIDGEVGEPPPGIARTLFPHTDTVRAAPGPSLLLPLGTPPRSAFRSFMVRVSGEPSPEPLNVLRSVTRTPAGLVSQLAIRGPREGGPLHTSEGPDPLRGLETTQRVLRGCAVLDALRRKTQRLGVLESDERATLVEVLGHLPADEAFPSLQHLLPGEAGETRTLRRRLAKLPGAPSSCVRIRARHAGVALEVGCDCRFAALPPGRYPTPLLHGMKVDDIAAFNRPSPTRPDAPIGPADGQVQAAARIFERRRRHYAEALRTLREAEAELARLMKAAGLSRVEVDGQRFTRDAKGRIETP